MKLKRLPEDFQVEELPLVGGGERGRFTFYRLTKSGMGTLEVVEAICRRWNLAGRRLSYGGLKDRHARTIQYLSIHDGPERTLKETSFELTPLGRLERPYGPDQFAGNRFVVTLRGLSHSAVEKAQRALAELPRDGLPNYFDDQRFGSVGFDGGFIAQAWLVGDHERALKLALAEPNPSDRPGTKAEKAVLREFWGRWPEAKAKLERSHARSIVTYLVDHPADFRGAFARVRRELRSLYFSAFQSHLWNLLLGHCIERITRPEQRVALDFKAASLPIHRAVDPDQARLLSDLRIPLPSSRNTIPEGPLREVASEVLSGFGLSWEHLRVKHLKDVFFSKGQRPALFFAASLAHSSAPDELGPGRRRLTLSFELPKGAYATLVVKRITDAAAEAQNASESPMNVAVLYEDNHCLVVDKPAGLLTQGDVTGERSLVDWARSYLKERYGKPGNVYVGLVHRLDQPTSGVVFLARTSKAAARLSAQFREGTIEKVYWAVVEGNCDMPAGEWVDVLRKDERRNVVETIEPGEEGGRTARVEFRVLGRAEGTTTLELRPMTGRSHQLRVQLAARGWPIVGDRKYGATRSLKAEDGGFRVALHARQLTFTHPTSKEAISVLAPTPADWPASGREATGETKC